MSIEVADAAVTDDLAGNLVPGGGMGQPVIVEGFASTVTDEAESAARSAVRAAGAVRLVMRLKV